MTIAFGLVADTVAPSPLLLAWTLLALCVLAAGVITALKGRWGWLWAGIVLGGLPWLVSAFLAARPGSGWERRRRAPG